MTPLAQAVYELLRERPALPEPRITYAELCRQLRDRAAAFELVNHRSRELYAALCEVGDECRRLRLPCLPALVVRADSGRPGAAYFNGASSAASIEAWRHEVDAVRGAIYPELGP